MILLLACVTLEAPADPAGAIPFPHASGYDVGTVHGAEALSVGTATCATCHREGARARPCSSCHDGYPHVAGWLDGGTHGVGLTGETGAAAREPCAACHGVDGSAAPSCTSCHASWPHAEGWALAGSHGLYAISRGSAEAACGSCHGSSLEGSDTAPSCTSCHADYPHSASWADPSVHGNADLTTCASCHGEGGTGGTAEVACSRCHATYPHAADWNTTGHWTTVEAVGQAVCLDCHGEQEGPTLPVTCGTSCHGGLP